MWKILPNPELVSKKDGQVFETDGATLKAFHTPGHTSDSIVLHFLVMLFFVFFGNHEKLLFTGRKCNFQWRHHSWRRYNCLWGLCKLHAIFAKNLRIETKSDLSRPWSSCQGNFFFWCFCTFWKKTMYNTCLLRIQLKKSNSTSNIEIKERNKSLKFWILTVIKHLRQWK